jgi:hypothetical protein
VVCVRMLAIHETIPLGKRIELVDLRQTPLSAAEREIDWSLRAYAVSLGKGFCFLIGVRTGLLVLSRVYGNEENMQVCIR